MDLDIDKFIFEIERRPAIWDMKCQQFSDRVQKIKQWEEVIELFVERGITTEEKQKQGQLLQKKWRNLRDAFVKQRKQRAIVKSGSGATRKQYKYYNQLLFLLPVTSTNATKNSIQAEETSDPVDRSSEENQVESARKKKKTTPTEEIGRELIHVLKSTMLQKTQEEDQDRQFFLSLVNDFKRVPIRLKPTVKINILKCIMEAQDEIYDFHPTHLNEEDNQEHISSISSPDMRLDTRSEYEIPIDQPSSSNINRVQESTKPNSVNTPNQSITEDQVYVHYVDTQDSDQSSFLQLFRN